MLDMRFRLPELMAERGIRNAYQLAKESRGALNTTTAQRLVSADGHPVRVELRILDILCDVLNVSPAELFERDKPRRR